MCVCMSQTRLQLSCIKPSEVVAGKAKSLTYFKDSEGKEKKKKWGNEWTGLTRAVCRSVSVLEGWQPVGNTSSINTLLFTHTSLCVCVCCVCVCVCVCAHMCIGLCLLLEAGLRDRQRRKCGCMRGRLGKTWAIIHLKIRFENILFMHHNVCNRYLTWNRKKH